MVHSRRFLRLLVAGAAAGEDTVKVVSTKVAEYDRSHAAGVVGRGLQENALGLLRAGCSG